MDYLPYRIPLVIGVTGHRNLDTQDQKLRGLISAALDKLHQDYPHTPFIVLSSLAEGADRLVAELALEHPRLDARLIAPLPLPPEEYAKDFATVASKDRFEALLQRADGGFVVPSKDQEAVSEGDARNRRYACAGAYIVENCQILIALWDGQSARGTGGTAEVVEWKKSGRIPADHATLDVADDWLLERSDAAWIIHINPITHTLDESTGGPQQPDAKAIFSKIEEFNRDVKEFVAEHGESLLQRSQADLLKDEDQNTRLKKGTLGWLLSLYGAADRLALHFQDRYRRLLYRLYVLFAASVFCFGIIDIEPHLIWVYIVTLPALILLYRFMKYLAHEDHFLDYRALAEGLRVLFFWRLSGIEERVSTSYLRKHSGILIWIRYALRNLETATRLQPAPNAGHGSTALALTEKLWINGQWDYFHGKQSRLSDQCDRLDRIALIGYRLLVGTALLYGVYVYMADFQQWFSEQAAADGLDARISSWLQGFMGLFGAVTLAVSDYKRRLALDEIAKQYALAERLFAEALQRLQQSPSESQKLLIGLGREALQENGEWLWWHRHQPPGPPQG